MSRFSVAGIAFFSCAVLTLVIQSQMALEPVPYSKRDMVISVAQAFWFGAFVCGIVGWVRSRRYRFVGVALTLVGVAPVVLFALALAGGNFT